MTGMRWHRLRAWYMKGTSWDSRTWNDSAACSSVLLSVRLEPGGDKHFCRRISVVSVAENKPKRRSYAGAGENVSKMDGWSKPFDSKGALIEPCPDHPARRMRYFSRGSFTCTTARYNHCRWGIMRMAGMKRFYGLRCRWKAALQLPRKGLRPMYDRRPRIFDAELKSSRSQTLSASHGLQVMGASGTSSDEDGRGKVNIMRVAYFIADPPPAE